MKKLTTTLAVAANGSDNSLTNPKRKLSIIQFLSTLMVLILIGFSQISYSQNTSTTSPDSYEITKEISKANASFRSSVEAANWDKYRMQSLRRTIKFENGVELELLSASELQSSGIAFKANRILPDQDLEHYKGIFKINANGHIMELHLSNQKKSAK